MAGHGQVGDFLGLSQNDKQRWENVAAAVLNCDRDIPHSNGENRNGHSELYGQLRRTLLGLEWTIKDSKRHVDMDIREADINRIRSILGAAYSNGNNSSEHAKRIPTV